MKFQYLLLLPALYSCMEKPANQPATVPALEVAEIKTADATTYQQYPATIKGIVDIEIRPQVSGILDQLLVEEGDFVKAGQPLFKINQAPFRERLNNAKSALSAAQGAFTTAEIEVEKLENLVADKVVSNYQLRIAQSSQKIAQASIDQAKASIATAQIDLGYTLIRAPVSGYIGLLQKKQGTLVSASDAAALTTLSDVHKVHVYFSLGESDFTHFKSSYSGKTLIDKISKLPPVTLILSDGSIYAENGKIDLVNGQFDQTTGSITVRATFSNADGLLRSGNTGRISLAVQHNNALKVPQSATFEVRDKTYVFTLADSNKVAKTAILVIGKSEQDYIVSEGVKAGDRIVTEGTGSLQEGMIIQPKSSKTKLLTANN